MQLSRKLLTVDVCPLCLTKHKFNMPHYKDSVFYQCTFWSQHKRWPTWNDAIAHCSQEMENWFWLIGTEQQDNLPIN